MIRYSPLGGVLLMLIACLPAWAEEHCAPIALDAGETALSVDGEIIFEDVRCYRLTAALEQRIAIEVLTGHNLVFSIQGQGESSDNAGEVPRWQTFTIVIGQLIASVDAQPYRLTIRLQP
ncbi:hypothetical protein [Onishia taeanensis]